MEIQLNGDNLEIPDHLSITQLLEHLCLTGKRLAVQHNQLIIPRSQHDKTPLGSGDEVEIIHAVGGG